MKKIISLIISFCITFQCFAVLTYAEDKVKDSQISSDEYIASLSEYVPKKRKFIPVYPKKNDIVLDGKTDDWENCYEIEAMRIKNYINSEVDATLYLKYTYDDENFYLLAVSNDDIWFPGVGSLYWNHDCLQLGFSRFSEPFSSNRKEYGVSYDSDANAPYLTHPDIVDAAIVREGTKTIYELSFSWQKIYGEKPDDFLFSVIAGDNDGNGRKYCVELSDGISEGKVDTEFPCMILVKDEQEGFMFLEGPTVSETNAKEDYMLRIFNPGESKKVNIFSKFLGINQEINIPEKSFLTKVYNRNIGREYGKLSIDLTNDLGIKAIGLDLYVNPTYEFFKDRILDLEKRIREIEGLIRNCNEQGIPTDYELVNLSIMKKFSGTIVSDIEIKHTDHLEYNFKALDKVYKDAKDRLTGYLMGSEKAKHVTRISADKPIDIVGNTLWGYATTNGVEEYRPVFLQGYGHFDRVARESEYLHNIGASYIVQELGPRYVMKVVGDYPYWDGISVNKERNIEITVQSEVTNTGNKAIKIVNGHPLTPYIYGSMVQPILIKPDTKYRFGGQVKSKNAHGVKITLNDWNEYTHLPENTDGWESFEVEYISKSDKYNTVLRLITEDICDELYLDDLYVYEEGSTENLLKNPGFEDDKDDYGPMIMDFNSYFGNFMAKVAKVQKNNAKLGITLSPHYFPSQMMELYPDISVGTPGFNKFRMDDERVRELMEIYIKALMKAIEDYNCVVDICLSNEPVYSPNANECYIPLWHNYLKKTYNDDIHLLNECYGTDYTSFEEVVMPGDKETTVLNFDYASFNNSIMLQFHKWMGETVHKYRPDLYVHVKLMGDMGGNYTQRTRGFYNYGYAWEDFADITDVIGFDGGSAYTAGEFLVNEFTETTHLTNWFKTDFITSIKDVPWINSETHIIPDQTDDFSMDATEHIGRYMWQEGIHGVGCSAIWVFDDRTRDPTFQGSIYYRPDAQLAIGRSMLDLNRLSHEVSAVSNAKRNIGVLYSYSARNYNDFMDNNSLSIYSAITFNGLKTKFVSDRQPEKLNKDIDLFFVPNAVCVETEILDAIIKYQDNGGRVVIFGEDSLTKTERNLPQDEDKLEKIYSRADVIPVLGSGYLVTSPRMYEVQEIVDKYVSEYNLAPVVIKDANTGEKVTDIEWEYNIYNGQLLVNLCSYHDYYDITNVNIYVNGKKLEKFKELRTGDTFVGTIPVDPGKPVLIRADIDNPFFDTYGHWAEESIVSLHNKGIIFGRTESEFVPEGTLTFAEWIALIVRHLGISVKEKNEGAHWAEPYVTAAKNAGIIGDISDYDRKITREEMCEIIVSAVENVQGKALEVSEVPFSDSKSINLSKVVGAGIIKGYEDNTFRPDSFLTRAEAATVLERIK